MDLFVCSVQPPTWEGVVSAPISALWLLRARGPVHVRISDDVVGGQVHRPVRCECPGSAIEGDWLIAADGEQVAIVCRCGRRQYLTAALEDLAAMVEAEPVRPHWTSLDDALNELGFTVKKPGR